MFISEIKIDTYNIPLPEPVEAYAAGVMKSFDLVICRITNDNGIEGVGYITVHENQGKAIAQIIKDSFIDLNRSINIAKIASSTEVNVWICDL